MMATVPHVISGLGLIKFQANGFLLTRVYLPARQCALPEVETKLFNIILVKFRTQKRT